MLQYSVFPMFYVIEPAFVYEVLKTV